MTQFNRIQWRKDQVYDPVSTRHLGNEVAKSLDTASLSVDSGQQYKSIL